MGRGQGKSGEENLFYGEDMGSLEEAPDWDLKRAEAIAADDQTSWQIAESIFDALYVPKEEYEKLSVEEKDNVMISDWFSYVFDSSTGELTEEGQFIRAAIASDNGEPSFELEVHNAVMNEHEDSLSHTIYRGRSLHELVGRAERWGQEWGCEFADREALHQRLVEQSAEMRIDTMWPFAQKFRKP